MTNKRPVSTGLIKCLLALVALWLLCFGVSGAEAAKTLGVTKPPSSVSSGEPESKPAEANKPDYSKEAFVIEKFAKIITFAEDGTSQLEQAAVIRVQSEAGVRQFGVLAFAYNSENAHVDVVYIRVRKPDGSVITTPKSDIEDISSDVTRAAPMYSDLREQQIPVKALGTGDVLEYAIRIVQTKPEITGQFWYSQNFLTGGVVLQETLQISVPVNKYVKVTSPAVKPEIREDGGRKIYSWKAAQLQASHEEETAKKSSPAMPVSSVQLTTFKNWEEVGRWYNQLQTSRVVVTPAIQAKADELTRGLAQNLDKQRAIYNYVATKFRYISVSFGQGRYQPHAAEEVLSNQYGDCKDKHTLFAALLRAAGIEAWPALIGSETKLDPEVPSPAQFDHVITVIPEQKGYLWLDTTPEVAPYGMLQQALRGKQALIIPSHNSPFLTPTPVDLPWASLQLFDVKSELSGEGILTGHFDVTLRGDAELIFRAALHTLAPAQWQAFVQGTSYQFGFAGTVSNVNVENLDALDKPLHYSYDYKREHYSGWDEHRITPPSPPISFSLNESSDKPVDPIDMGSPGEMIFRTTVHLPEGYSLEIPENVSSNVSFAEYHATYSVKEGVLSSERRMVVHVSKVAATGWSEYLKFEKAVLNDENQFIQIVSTGGKTTAVVAANNPEAQDLLRQTYEALQRHDTNAARDLLAQTERLNAKQAGLWAMRGYLYFSEHEIDKGIDALRKEIQNHPEEAMAYKGLSQMQLQLGRRDDAIETLRTLVQKLPNDMAAVSQLSVMLMADKRYAELLATVRTALASQPDDSRLQAVLVEALLRTGRKEEALAVARKLGTNTKDASVLNNAAYSLADNKTDLPLSREFAEKAVSLVEEKMKSINLTDLTNEDLNRVTELATFWDTLGWAYFRSGDTDQAKKYINAAWKLSQNGAAADHLGQIYEGQGKREEAIHAWRLALAANSGLKDTQERLRNLGAGSTVSTPLSKTKTTVRVRTIDPGEELGKLRTIGVPSLSKQEGSAEFFILFSHAKVEDAQFISGDESLRGAKQALSEANYDFDFPDEASEKVVRRGILSCSSYTSPSCQFVLLLPSTTKR